MLFRSIYALPEGEELPETIEWTGNIPNGKMTLLQGNKNIKYTKDKEKTKVFLPRNLKNEPIVLRFKVKK